VHYLIKFRHNDACRHQALIDVSVQVPWKVPMIIDSLAALPVKGKDGRTIGHVARDHRHGVCLLDILVSRRASELRRVPTLTAIDDVQQTD
jgi:hypothetical protein